MGWADGKAVEAAPQVGPAVVCREPGRGLPGGPQSGDVPAHRRYSEALERCLQFLATLQYTEANTQHFATWYRPRLVGGFHASHQDGNLRIDYTQHAVARWCSTWCTWRGRVEQGGRSRLRRLGRSAARGFPSGLAGEHVLVILPIMTLVAPGQPMAMT